MKCSVIKIATGSPSDVEGVRACVEDGTLLPGEVIAVIGKTEGNGCVNDFTRGYAVRCLSDFFAPLAEEASRISYVMSGGTEGVLSPHLTIVSRSGRPGGTKGAGKYLAAGVARTRSILAEELGRIAQVREVADAVHRAMEEAGIESPEDVHFVQIKCPLLSSGDIHGARSRGAELVTEDTYESMGYSRGASALGVALALGEAEELRDADICDGGDKFSSVASASGGIELDYCEVIVLGNSLYAEGPYFIDHGVMRDAIDAEALRSLLARHEGAELVQVLAKAEADPDGYVRSRRHTMLNDSDINHTRHARAVVGGVLASVCGDPMIYVSGGAEHQVPPGGGPVAAIFKAVT
ncbi:ring-opening amidohydrolase [Paenibacillus humicola]|uniref:cyanuric acid amidohydrolase n=1 Tax=Paenibacillus humicola TaxID=3110540 RepID=UPI00237C4A3C|nr:ring-opening amidohydrolase [Paenibacillus humicola]